MNNDISRCLNGLCPNAPTCLRTQLGSEFPQGFQTFEYEMTESGVKCDFYLEYKTELIRGE